MVKHLISDVFRRVFRFLAWNYRLFSVHTGNKVQLVFPLRIEGGGKLSIGDHSSVKKNVRLSMATGGSIILEKKVSIFSGVNLHAGNNTSIRLKDNSKILKNSTLRNGNHVELDAGSCISSHCDIFPRENGLDGKFILGKGSNIGDYTLIDTCDDVVIKDLVAVGPYCILYTHDHDHSNDQIAAWKGKIKTGKIIIEKGAWVGARVTILPGVTIGEKAVVAAGSVVNKDVLPGDVVGGIPAKSLKKNNHERIK